MKYIEINGKKIKVFTPKDLSELIGYSEGWVRERIKRGELRCSISNVPPYLFTIIDINNFSQKNGCRLLQNVKIF